MAPAASHNDLTRHFRAERKLQLISAEPNRAQLGVLRAQHGSPHHGLTDPLPLEPIFSVVLQLRDQPHRALYLNGRLACRDGYQARTTSIANHLKRPQAALHSPFDFMIFRVPQDVLNDVTDDQGARRIARLDCPRGTMDETVWHLGTALLPALERPQEFGSLYVDSILLAACTYFAVTFGEMRLPHRPKRGTLAPWQLRRATDLMGSRLGSDLSLAELATACELSLSYFKRAFRSSTGESPHRWLQHQRVSHAKVLMATTGQSLAEIAVACGFADQSHFTRVFSAVAGTSPAVWRRTSKN
jgi:AraC family transcriptional regulator